MTSTAVTERKILMKPRTRTELLELRREKNRKEAREPSTHLPGSSGLSKSVPAVSFLGNMPERPGTANTKSGEGYHSDVTASMVHWPSRESSADTRRSIAQGKKLRNESKIEFKSPDTSSNVLNNEDGEDHFSVYRRRSAIVTKRIELYSGEVSEKPNNVSIVLEDGNCISKVSLWDATFCPGRNERSGLDDSEKPLFSSFAMDGIFRPERACKAMKVLESKGQELHRTLLKKKRRNTAPQSRARKLFGDINDIKTEQWNPNSFIIRPLRSESDMNTAFEQRRNRLRKNRNIELLDQEHMKNSHLSDSALLSDAFSDMGVTMSIASSNATEEETVTYRPTPRTWSPIRPAGQIRAMDAQNVNSRPETAGSRADSPAVIMLNKRYSRNTSGSIASTPRSRKMKLPDESLLLTKLGLQQHEHSHDEQNEDRYSTTEDIFTEDEMSSPGASLSKRHNRSPIRAIKNSSIITDGGLPVMASPPSSASVSVQQSQTARAKMTRTPFVVSSESLPNAHDFRSRPSTAGMLYPRMVRTGGFL